MNFIQYTNTPCSTFYLYFVRLVKLRVQLTCYILCGADLGAVCLVAVPPQVVVADLNVVLLWRLLVLIEA